MSKITTAHKAAFAFAKARAAVKEAAKTGDGGDWLYAAELLKDASEWASRAADTAPTTSNVEVA